MPDRMQTFSSKVFVKRRAPDVRPSATARGYCSRGWFALRKIVLIRDSYACCSCGRICTGKREAQVDHIVSKSRGGTDDVANLQTLCIRCHSRKTNREGGLYRYD